MRSSATGRALNFTGAFARRVLLRDGGLNRVNCPVPVVAPNTITE
jgi:hypothetical protein